MKTNAKLLLVLLATFSLGVIGGCSSNEPKKENPINTAANTMAVPGGDPADKDVVNTEYSSADLGAPSSGMGR